MEVDMGAGLERRKLITRHRPKKHRNDMLCFIFSIQDPDTYKLLVRDGILVFR
jgi:hypothetical protein